jgi:imidazolonepropionase-like amidohydrolase/ectoine hydroxylase-related dioxygenase (phytanoyl-CoA dioxygenase family)
MAAIEEQLGRAIAIATRGAWRLERVERERDHVAIVVHDGAGPLVIEARPASAGRPAYRTVEGWAFGYRPRGDGGVPDLSLLGATVDALAPVLASSDPAEAPAAPPPLADFPTAAHLASLAEPHPLPAEATEHYRREGYALLRGVLDRQCILAAGPAIEAALARDYPHDVAPLAERRDAYAQAFVQVVNLGLRHGPLRALTRSRRLARIAAELMGVRGARIHLEDWFLKEPGAGITPWHQDASVLSMDVEASITAWVPLCDVDADMGLIRYALRSHRMGLAEVPVDDICDDSERAFGEVIAREGFAVRRLPPLAVGDVSFHDGMMMHSAGANTSPKPRLVLALHYFADGARVRAPTRPSQARALADFAPTLRAGDLASCAGWPLVYRAEAEDDPPTAPASATAAATASATARSYHLRATILPAGGAPTDLWIHEGRLRLAPVAGAEELDAPGGFVLSGMVDCHAHISWPHERGAPAHTVAFMDANRLAYARAGVTLLRDMGSHDDAILALPARAGLPGVHASGLLVLRHDEYPFTPTPPERLREVFLERIARGARWVKVFTDWSSDFVDRDNTGFGADDELTYPTEILADAVAAVHRAGGRVGAHCFTVRGTEAAVRAGADTLEHGWGADERLVEEMAARGIAWVPLAGIAAAMWRTAREHRQPERAAWIERSMASLARLLPRAARLGVTILAGTDWFPEVGVEDEVAELHGLGLDAATALAAGTWAARAFLGEPGIVDGAPADLVVYRSDPRLDLAALSAPSAIVIGGARVDPRDAGARPRHVPWREREAAAARSRR